MPDSSAKRRPATPDVTSRLKALQAAREKLDADATERRRREDEALHQHAIASGKLDQLTERRDAKLAELQRTIAKVEADFDDEAAAIKAEQEAAIRALKELGRTADELAVLFTLPVKAVRRILCAGRDQSNPDEAAEPRPEASSAGSQTSDRQDQPAAT